MEDLYGAAGFFSWTLYYQIYLQKNAVVERSPTSSPGKQYNSKMTPEQKDASLIRGPSSAKHSWGESETIMQINRCMPRPNDWILCPSTSRCLRS